MGVVGEDLAGGPEHLGPPLDDYLALSEEVHCVPALAQELLNRVFFKIFGLAIMNWQGLFPLGFLVLALFIFPNGVTGPGGINRQRLNDLWSDVKKVLGFTREDTAS
jgi:hypothetical protein